MTNQQPPIIASNVTIEMSNTHTQEVTVSDIIDASRKHWIPLFLIVFSTTICALIYAYTQPNIYQSSVLLAPAGEDSGNSLGGLTKQLGGIASIAGINIGKGSNQKTQITIETLQSRHFITNLLKSNGFIPSLHASKRYNQLNQEIEIDTTLYDTNHDTWLDDSLAPSDWVIYSSFLDSNFNMEIDSDTGIIRLNFRTISPKLSYKLADTFVSSINEAARERDMDLARENIKFIEESLNKTKLNEIREVLNALLEEQLKALMLASSQKEYALITIDPPYVPDEIFSPRRIIIAAAGPLIGTLIGFMYILVVCIVHKSTQSNDK